MSTRRETHIQKASRPRQQKFLHAVLDNRFHVLRRDKPVKLRLSTSLSHVSLHLKRPKHRVIEDRDRLLRFDVQRFVGDADCHPSPLDHYPAVTPVAAPSYRGRELCNVRAQRGEVGQDNLGVNNSRRSGLRATERRG